MDLTTRTLWTIGHSTRPLETLVEVLKAADIRLLVDVRRYAGSKRNPQYSGASLAASLPERGIAYLAMPELGGRRDARADSRNLAWRNTSFRGYADYMETAAFSTAAAELARRARATRTAVMCAEALWWQCHRGLIADAFKVRGWEVIHLVAPGLLEPHPYTSAARVVDGRLDYGVPEAAQGSLF